MSLDKLAEKLAGVVAIPVTAFDGDGAVDEPACVRVMERIVGAGVDVVTPNGNTGEFYALGTDEARRVVELTMRTVGSGATVVAGVGGSVPEAVAAARHARRAGAQAIMVHQPVHPYASQDDWVEYHRAIAGAVPDLGVLLYLRNPRIGGAHLARLGELAPNVIGVKYAVPDPVRFASVARDAGLGRFVWIAGLAELAAPGYWAVGATGFTSGLVNVHPELSLSMLAALRAGDYPAAMRVWESARPFEELRAEGESENNVSVVKEALAQLGLCRRTVRPPSHPVDEPTRRRIGELLESWGLGSPEMRMAG
ncbi:dihydrodipicolinate synthase family protein [Gandjariella thermophila]|uniref:Dihydrodipicolinate synthase family protein n=1 Tax=Gandjariella thermophila TaxID=1931992 RepID=A0A4D4IZM9_9PSEU|nr:dihydrodipicolinate synthase family protein [Gandjariella thermophila]GDY29795.1 dihydrodipicolinate synthase family protein [Gandjariella thermophila]